MGMVKKKNPHAVAMGKLGGKARLTKMTSVQRSAVARKAAQARWAKHKAKESKDEERGSG